jgi:hypothetical protein
MRGPNDLRDHGPWRQAQTDARVAELEARRRADARFPYSIGQARHRLFWLFAVAALVVAVPLGIVLLGSLQTSEREPVPSENVPGYLYLPDARFADAEAERLSLALGFEVRVPGAVPDGLRLGGIGVDPATERSIAGSSRAVLDYYGEEFEANDEGLAAYAGLRVRLTEFPPGVTVNDAGEAIAFGVTGWRLVRRADGEAAVYVLAGATRWYTLEVRGAGPAEGALLAMLRTLAR